LTIAREAKEVLRRSPSAPEQRALHQVKPSNACRYDIRKAAHREPIANAIADRDGFLSDLSAPVRRQAAHWFLRESLQRVLLTWA
jgi:hypothetical protein